MALHDYWCVVCGQLLVDVYRSVEEGGRAHPPMHCDRPMHWMPGTTAMDIGAVKTSGFQGFWTTDGRGQRVHVDSLHKMRQVEREAEQAYRNGEGQPMVFRRWAQDGSNRDQPTLSQSYEGSEQPTPEAKHRFGSTLQKFADEPDQSYGPGVSDQNASALPLEGK